MPVSFDQIVDAFSIMWCITLKCRKAVPDDSSWTAVRFSYQRPIAAPSVSRTNKRPNSERMPSTTLFSRLAERFFMP